jgi:DNA-binding XRE family transcriptional regulator
MTVNLCNIVNFYKKGFFMKSPNAKGIRLGAAIRRMRRERSLTQKRLASILGISTPYLNLIENNRRNVTGKILIILAQEFNI